MYSFIIWDKGKYSYIDYGVKIYGSRNRKAPILKFETQNSSNIEYWRLRIFKN